MTVDLLTAKVVMAKNKSFLLRLLGFPTREVNVGREYGGGATLAPDESASGTTVVVIDPEALAGGSAGWAELAFRLTFDEEVTALHELGHALAIVEGRPLESGSSAVELENQLRARRGGRGFRPRHNPIGVN